MIVLAEGFELLVGGSSLESYRFNTGTAKHRFCRNCGIHPFSRPRSHPDGFDVNVRCLDDWEIDDLDGRNWELRVDEIR